MVHFAFYTPLPGDGLRIMVAFAEVQSEVRVQEAPSQSLFFFSLKSVCAQVFHLHALAFTGWDLQQHRAEWELVTESSPQPH